MNFLAMEKFVVWAFLILLSVGGNKRNLIFHPDQQFASY